MSRTTRLSPKEASVLMHAAEGRIIVAGPYDEMQRVERMKDRMFLDETGHITTLGRLALSLHIEDGKPIAGWEKTS